MPLTHIDIATRIAQLPELPMENLWALWDEHFDCRPRHHHRTYLESRLAYKLQEIAFGGLPTTLRRRLEKIGETGDIPQQKRRAECQLTPGTLLIREFDGRTHRVLALDDGRFEWEGRAYKSLTAVARTITGTSYSGPVFFGLKPSSRQRRNAQ